MFSASSLLFVPGSRPDRFAKAKAAGAGLTVIDLEDAVPSGEKETARAAALSCIAESADQDWGLRINAVTTAEGICDLAVLTQTTALPAVLLVPMVESAVEIDIIQRALGDVCPGLIPLIETPKGLRHAREIGAADRTIAVMLGGADFSAELGVELAWEPLLTVRQQLILACAENSIPAIDVPFIRLEDEAGLVEECIKAERFGFAAKAAIHPRQIGAIESAFTPSEDAVSEAREALRAYAEAGERAIRYNGRMLEAPLVKKFRAIIARSEGKQNA